MDHTRRTALLSAAALCLVLGGLFWLAVREDTPVPAAAPGGSGRLHRQLGPVLPD